MTLTPPNSASPSAESATPFRSGFVAVAGKPNVGKSTLINRLIGAKVAIVTHKAQTTRDRVLGILSTPDYQIVFVDTPGLIEPRNRFNHCLMDEARAGVRDVDLLLHLVDARDPEPFSEEVSQALADCPARKFLVINKIDVVHKPRELDPAAAAYAETFSISALQGDGVDNLLRRTVEVLPEGPHYYDEDTLSDRDERFHVAEIVREKVFLRMAEEIPYGAAVIIDEFQEREHGKTFIRAVVYVEHDSQKGMIIGKGGRALKAIGAAARPEIEELIGCPVYLELWVKVRKNWTKKDNDLRFLGYLKNSKDR